MIYILHLPPCFFPGKEALLIIIDEIRRRSISSALDERVKQLNGQAAEDPTSILDTSDRGSTTKRVSPQSKLRFGLNKNR